MKVWANDPSSELVAVFSNIAQIRMHDVPTCNPALCIEAVGFQCMPQGQWAGVMVTPWAINRLGLPGQTDGWPLLAACSKHGWHISSGDYEFTVAGRRAFLRLGR